MEPKKMTIGGLLHQYVNNYAACCGNLTPEEMEAHGNNHRLMHNELLRRLNEADALRKENAELRKDKERLDWINERREWIFDINKASHDPSSLRLQVRDSIDAAIAKEREAAHE